MAEMLVLGLATPPSPVFVEGLLRGGIEAVHLEPDVATARPRLPFVVRSIALAGPLGKRGRAELIAEDREERDVALTHCLAALEWLSELGCRHALVRLGAPRAIARYWDDVRDQFTRGQLLLDDSARLVVLAERAQILGAAFDHARGALDRLLRRAERDGVTLSLCNPRRFVELPAPDEAEALFRDLHGAPLVGCFDGPAAHLTSAMDLWSVDWLRRVFDTETSVATFVGDACGPIGGLAPGRGILGRALPVGRGTPVFSPWRGLASDEAIAAHQAMVRHLAAQ